MGDKGDKNAARPPEGSLVETRCLIKDPKSAIVPFAEPRSGPKSRTGSGASQKAKSYEVSYSPVIFVTFTASVKASVAIQIVVHLNKILQNLPHIFVII